MKGTERRSHLRRAFLSVLICLAVVLAPAASLRAAAAGAGRIIRVGFFAFDGYHIQDADGARSGYGYDFLQELARYAGWTYDYVGYDKSWSDMQQMLASGEIDLLTSAQKTAEREKQFAFSAESIGTSSAILTVKSGDSRRTAGRYSTYDGMRVGLLTGSSRNDVFAAYAAQKGFTYTPVYYDTVSAMTADLQAGVRVDALVTSNLRTIDSEWILDRFDSSDFYVMVRKGDAALLSEVNAAIEQLDSNQPNWRAELWNTYYTADSGGEIPFTPDEREYIRSLTASGTRIRAVVEPDRAPYSYFKNGTAMGIIPDIFGKISAMTGLDFELVETSGRTEYFSALANDESISVRIDAFSDYYNAEQSGFKLTGHYLTASVSAVTLADLAAQPASVAVVRKADPSDYRTAALNSGMIVREYDSLTDCLNAVRDGSADTTYTLTYVAQRYLGTSDQTGRLNSTLLPQYSVSYAVGVRSSADVRLLTILSKAVANLKNSDVEGIVLSQTQVLAGRLSFFEYLSVHPAVLALFCSILFALAALIFLIIVRRRSLHAIEKINEQLRAEALRADRASEAKSAFLQSVSHDMRTPLNGTIGFMDFALKENDPARKQELLKKARQSSAILLSLINDTLEVSRIESGKLELQPEDVRLQDFCSGIVLVIGSDAETRGIRLEYTLDCPGMEYIRTDRTKVQDLLMNLLTNAVKFSREGGTVRLAITRIDPPGKDPELQIVVSDEGVGISKEFLPRIYDAFAQERDPGVRNATGSGMGMYIVKRIVTLLNGTIDVKSEKGAGTEFTVCLPVEILQPGSLPEKKPTPVYDFSGRKVLLCEDNYINTEIAQMLLAEKHIGVVCAENGRQGTELFIRSAPGEFDAVLMDLNMPEMDGYAAAETIRRMIRADAKTVPIIAMTADAYREDIERCLSSGMNGHIAKPIDPDKLYRMLQKVFDRQKS